MRYVIIEMYSYRAFLAMKLSSWAMFLFINNLYFVTKLKNNNENLHIHLINNLNACIKDYKTDDNKRYIKIYLQSFA